MMCLLWHYKITIINHKIFSRIIIKNTVSESNPMIEKILKEATVCRIALFDNNYPYIVPMNYGYNNNFIYFHCAPTGKKIDLIRQNNNVGFEIELFSELVTGELACSWTTKFCSVIGQGAIEIIVDSELKQKGLDIIMQQHGSHNNTYNKKSIAKMVLLQLTIHNVTAKIKGNCI